MAFAKSFSTNVTKSYGKMGRLTLSDVDTRSQSIEKASRAYIPDRLYRDNAAQAGRAATIDMGEFRTISSKNLRKMYVVVRKCIDTIIETIVNTDWKITKKDKTSVLSKEEEDDLAKRTADIKKVFTNPNKQNETFTQLMKKFILDILVLDIGAIEKVYDSSGNLSELYVLDSSTLKVEVDEHGAVQKYTQVLDLGDQKDNVEFSKEELLYIVWHPTTFTLYGMPILETLQNLVSGFLYSESYNIKYFENNATPRGILDLGVYIGEEEMDRFREYWRQENLQQPHRVMVLGGPISGTPERPNQVRWIPLAISPKDMEMMQYLTWITKMLLIAFGLTEQDIGMQASAAPATTHYLSSLAFKNRAILPLLTIISDFFTEHILNKELKHNDLQFEFVEEVTVQEKIQQAQYNQMRIMSQEASVDEVRAEQGKPPAPPQQGQPGQPGQEGQPPQGQQPDQGQDQEQGQEGDEGQYNEDEDREIQEWLEKFKQERDMGNQENAPEHVKAFTNLSDVISNIIKKPAPPSNTDHKQVAMNVVEAVKTALANKQGGVDTTKFLQGASSPKEAVQNMVGIVNKFIKHHRSKRQVVIKRKVLEDKFDKLYSVIDKLYKSNVMQNISKAQENFNLGV